jgi:hypothetical protein
MDIKDFNAGSHKTQYEYKSFMPIPINIDWQASDSGIINLLCCNCQRSAPAM